MIAIVAKTTRMLRAMFASFEMSDPSNPRVLPLGQIRYRRLNRLPQRRRDIRTFVHDQGTNGLFPAPGRDCCSGRSC
jgi:hypothetical protein